MLLLVELNWRPLIAIMFYALAICSYGEPISMGIAVGTAFALSAGLSGYTYFKCKFYECCDNEWVHLNVTGLQLELNNRLYGQPLVVNTVVRALKSHYSKKNPSKALVLSFHGWTGSGKNFVADIITRNLYKKGKSSSYVHVFLPTLHFQFGNASSGSIMPYLVHSMIKRQVNFCPKSLFIFDEVDKIPVSVLNTIKPFIDHYDSIDGVDYRKCTFILMSNTGGNDITETTFQHWRKGINRQEIKLADLESLIINAAYNEDGGLRFSDLIRSHLIDHYIPFLPLEKSHVKLCIQDYLTQINFTPDNSVDEFVSKIADSLQYFPKGVDLYSTSGCKRVQQKVDLHIEEQFERQLERFDRSIDHRNDPV